MRQTRWLWIRELMGRHEALLLLTLVLLVGVFGWVMPRFLNWNSQGLLSRPMWELALLSLGMTLIIVSGGIDLSVGSMMGLCAVAFGAVFAATANLPLSCVACLVTGLIGGAVNGAIIAKARVHPLIVTLATYATYRGIAEGASQGVSYSQFGEAFAWLGRGRWGGVPVAGFLFLVLMIAFALFLARTRFGRYLYAIGNNAEAARFSGIPVGWMQFWLYATSGLLAGLATLIYVSRFNTAKADAGMGYELDVITAVVVGGTSIFGGRGTMIGTLFGLLLIHETRLFVGWYWRVEELKSIFVGSLLIVAVIVYRRFAERES